MFVNSYEQSLIEKAARVLPGGSNGNTIYQGLIIKKGLGARVWDESDNEYIDYSLGSGPMILGHAHPEVVEAVTERIAKGTTFFGLNEPSVHLAEEIVSAVPCAERVRFASSGTEATFHAMRVARAYRKRDKILKFEGGYHGMNDYALMSMAPSVLSNFPKPIPDTPGIPDSVTHEMMIAPFNDIDKTVEIVERCHEELAAIIVEPLQRIIPPAPGFLEGLREITNKHGVLLIFDEVVTGFRFAYGGAQEYYGVVPDICALGKAVSGGYPLSVIAGKEEIMDLFSEDQNDPYGYVLQEGTFNGNPVAATAGLTTLNVLKRPGTYEHLFRIGDMLKNGFQQLLFESEVPGIVIGEPPMFDVVFIDADIKNYRDSLRRDITKASQLVTGLRHNGIYKNDAKFYVSTAHDEDDVNQTLEAFKLTLAQM